MLEEANTMLEALIRDEHYITNIGQVYKKIYDSFVSQGFTEDQALAIVVQFKLS